MALPAMLSTTHLLSDTQHATVNCVPPSLYIVNVQWGSSDHHEMSETRFVFPSFFTALKSIEQKPYALEGATYTPDGGSIFIDSEDKDWVLRAVESEEEPEDVAQFLETLSTSSQPTASTTGPQVIIFNGSSTKVKKSSSGPIEEKSLLSSFISVCQCIYAKRYIVQGATLAPVGCRIFILAKDELWQTYLKF